LSMTKRAADKQLTKDNAEVASSDDDQMLEERKMASEEVIAQRRIVKAKRSTEHGTESTGAFASLAPRAALTPLPTLSPKAAPSSPKKATESPKQGSPKPGASPKETSPKSGTASPQHTSPKHASPQHQANQSPKFSTSPKQSPRFGSSLAAPSFFPTNPFATLFPTSSSEPSPQPAPLFKGFGAFSSTGTFGTFGQEEQTPEDDEEPPKEEPTLPALTEVLSGEEGETLLYQHDCKLFRLTKIHPDQLEDVGDESRIASAYAGDESRLGSSSSAAASAGFRWVEKGAGFVRVLKSNDEKVRIVVRMKGVLRVLLNSPAVPREGGTFQKEGAKSVKFKAFDETGSIAWFRLNLLQVDQQEAFVHAAEGQ
jgi:hypothetical protein